MRAKLVALSGALLMLGACASPPSERHVAMNCGSAMPRSDPGPYRPGVLCLAYQGEIASPTTGARSGADRPAMKAVRVDGRVYFVNISRDGPLPAPM
jgi:hypothetical protein